MAEVAPPRIRSQSEALASEMSTFAEQLRDLDPSDEELEAAFDAGPDGWTEALGLTESSIEPEEAAMLVKYGEKHCFSKTPVTDSRWSGLVSADG
jgi:hypothetical protein